MPDYSGEFIASLLVALVGSWVASLVITRRYRSTVRRLMNAPTAARAVQSRAIRADVSSTSVPSRVGILDNRRAGWQLTAVIAGLSCLIAMTATWIWMTLAVPDVNRTVTRVAAMSVYNLWPVVPAVGLVWRWSFLRLLLAFALWSAMAVAVQLGSSAEARLSAIGMAFVIDVIPSLIITLVFFNGATRPVAAWLFLPLVGLAASLFAGMRLLSEAAAGEAAWLKTIIAPLEALPSTAGLVIVLMAFALLPPVLAWWPLRRFGRMLGRRYARQQLSELLVVFSAVWAVLLLGFVATTMGTAGPWAALLIAPLLWIPAVMWPYSRRATRAADPPTLLVLRVFQRDRAAHELFDRVVERWRLSGNTLLIAGTDLADRLLDPDDMFTFLDRRLDTRLIATSEDIAKRIGTFVLTPDAEGRLRVNKCYCHDSTWQPTLQALVNISDVVLMDLRDFQAQNAGCRFELATLAHAARDLRAVVLTDAATDQDAMRQSIAGGRTDRFVCLRIDRLDRPSLDRILRGLFDAS